MKITFELTGVRCARCALHIEQTLKKIPELTEIIVDPIQNTLIVGFDVEEHDPVEVQCLVREAVHLAGYDAIPEPTEPIDKSLLTRARQSKSELGLAASLLFLVPLMYVSMGHMVGLPLPSWLLASPFWFGLSQLILTLPILVINRSFFINGFAVLGHGVANMDTLVATGCSASLSYSLVVLFLIGACDPVKDAEMIQGFMHDFYFESAAMILVIVSFGRLLETMAKRRTTRSIEALLALTPDTATLLKDGREFTISPKTLSVGDEAVVRPGQRIPADGVIIDGSTAIDESALTGESMPVDRRVDEPVTGGTINLSGRIVFRVTRAGEDTALAKIIHLVEEASASKAPTAKLADQVCSVFVPVVMSVSAVAFILWLLAGASVAFALSMAIAVLVVSCPCALGLATPAAVMVGMGAAARQGILFKSAEALEHLSKTKTVVFDKTGTITIGRPEVCRCVPFGITDVDFLRAAGSLESNSTHPLSEAVVNYVRQTGVNQTGESSFACRFDQVYDFHVFPGQGVTGIIGQNRWYSGNQKYIESQGIVLSSGVLDVVGQIAQQGDSMVIYACNDRVVGVIELSDTIRSGSVEAVASLERWGINTVLLTGDNRKSAEQIAREVNISHVEAEVSPDRKAEVIESIQRPAQGTGRLTAMVGDGINDAVALTCADVGIAMGTGTDVAMESADVILQKSDLRAVPQSVRISRLVVRTIRFNLFWAFVYNVIGIPIAAGVFYTSLGWKMSPMLAAAAMSLSSICVVFNALTLNPKIQRTSERTSE